MTSYYLTDTGRRNLESLRDHLPEITESRHRDPNRKADSRIIIYTVLSAVDKGETFEDMFAHIVDARNKLSPGAQRLSDAMAGSDWTLQRAEEHLREVLRLMIQKGFIEEYESLPEAFSDFRMYE